MKQVKATRRKIALLTALVALCIGLPNGGNRSIKIAGTIVDPEIGRLAILQLEGNSNEVFVSEGQVLPGEIKIEQVTNRGIWVSYNNFKSFFSINGGLQAPGAAQPSSGSATTGPRAGGAPLRDGDLSSLLYNSQARAALRTEFGLPAPTVEVALQWGEKMKPHDVEQRWLKLRGTLNRYLKQRDRSQGVRVEKETYGLLKEAGLRQGDVIRSVGGMPIDQFKSIALEAQFNSGLLSVVVERGGRTEVLEITPL